MILLGYVVLMAIVTYLLGAVTSVRHDIAEKSKIFDETNAKLYYEMQDLAKRIDALEGKVETPYFKGPNTL